MADDTVLACVAAHYTVAAGAIVSAVVHARLKGTGFVAMCAVAVTKCAIDNNSFSSIIGVAAMGSVCAVAGGAIGNIAVTAHCKQQHECNQN